MAYDYGYGKLGNKLVELFRSGKVDFDAAEDLIRQGADVNTIGKDDDENILSVVIENLCDLDPDEAESEACNGCEKDDCTDCAYHHDPHQNVGSLMCAVIRFFLDHGFDVNRCDGCFGAQCLYALTLSTFDRYMIVATKILLDAGARNRTTSLTSTDELETPWDFIATEGSYQGTCKHNYVVDNIFYAVYQIYQAVEDGRPYSGIDSCEMAVGKKILRVLAEKDEEKPVFFAIDLPEFKKDHCYNATLYFVYEGGALVSTQYAEFWTDTVLPDADLVDVSEQFDGVVGNTIEQFAFDHRSIEKGTTSYGQPITTMKMDSGREVRFSINFGEVADENRAAFYELL